MPFHYEDDKTPEPCKHPDHEPPTMIVIPRGKVLVHKCPSCGRITKLRPTSFATY